MGIHIIRFDGGLGNQMFEYAFYLSLRHRHPLFIYAFDTVEADTSHNGFELDRIFHVSSSRERNRHALYRKLERHNWVNFSEVKEENFMTYCPRIYESSCHPHMYYGYWQTEKYFLPIEKKIRQVYSFREELLSEQTKAMAEDIRNSGKTISLHVRRGDYVNINNTQTFGTEYYDAAIALLRTKYAGGKIIVFSDDKDWTKKHIQYENMVVVDWNTGANSWQDMYLMSQCTYNIIANSSFSWWGAWLNNHPEKVVIAPKKWMTDEGAHTDIIPESWIRM